MVSQRTRIWFPFAALSFLYVLQTAEGRGMFGGGGGMMEGDRRLTKTEDALTGKTWMLERTIKESGEVRPFVSTRSPSIQRIGR